MQGCFINKDTLATPSAMPLPHQHNFYELYILIQGKRSFFIENEEFHLEKNDLILVPANLLHRTSGNYYTRYLVNFFTEYLDEFQLKTISLCQQQKISMTQKEADAVTEIVEHMYLIQQDTSKDNKEINEHDFKSCFSYLIMIISKLTNFPSEKYSKKQTYNLRTYNVINYLQEHYHEKITLDSICNLFFVSKSVLCKDFKENTNMSIIDFLLKIRIDQAQKLLIRTNKKISEISEQCGFSSPRYFYLIFSKHVQLSPSQYRKQYKITKKINF